MNNMTQTAEEIPKKNESSIQKLTQKMKNAGNDYYMDSRKSSNDTF